VKINALSSCIVFTKHCVSISSEILKRRVHMNRREVLKASALAITAVVAPAAASASGVEPARKKTPFPLRGPHESEADYAERMEAYNKAIGA